MPDGLGLVDPLAVRVTRAPHLLDAVSRRLWDATDIVSELTAHYDALSVDIKAELPLKRVWTLLPEAET